MEEISFFLFYYFIFKLKMEFLLSSF